ncbi:hypothetical protein ACQPUY_07495 [Clostridium nigeriense]|uniref:hypothetical protein n=1 Tax=Clostridium nigeriense TaxID=1805470 RepID=UPI003D3425D5
MIIADKRDWHNNFYEKKRLGCVLVDYAEEELLKLDIRGVYVTAYGPALGFWKK